MIQRRCGPGLTQQTPTRVDVVQRFCRKQLDGNPSLEFRVMGQKHFTHAARAELFDNSIVSDLCGEQAGLLRANSKPREGTIHRRVSKVGSPMEIRHRCTTRQLIETSTAKANGCQ